MGSLISAPPLVSTHLETPVGDMVVVTDDQGIHLFEFSDRTALPTEMRRIQKRFGAVTEGTTAMAGELARQMAEYFAGTRTTFALPILQRGSPFTARVWAALVDIPFGETRSYGAVAATIAAPTAVRAVARANGANTVAIIVPCHRVIGADGSLTGYGGKLWRKRWLLDHEQRSRSLF